MLVRLTRNQRMKVGWIVALFYLLCVMAPTLSYALPGQHVVPCMSMGALMTDSMRMHDEAVQPIHAHLDGQAHGHSAPHAMAMSGDDQSSMASAMDDDEAPGKTGPHSSGSQCCATMCVTAMPASLVDLATPPMPRVVQISTSYRATADNAPAVQYRPPIA
jgi:hypothetical protein